MHIYVELIKIVKKYCTYTLVYKLVPQFCNLSDNNNNVDNSWTLPTSIIYTVFIPSNVLGDSYH
jgi:hypothetical protein